MFLSPYIQPRFIALQVPCVDKWLTHKIEHLGLVVKVILRLDQRKYYRSAISADEADPKRHLYNYIIISLKLLCTDRR